MYHVVNIMTKYGETNHFQACDFIATLESFTRRKITAAIVNKKRPDDRLLELYRQQKSEFVEIGLAENRCNIIAEDLLETSGDIIRHDPQKLANLFRRIIFKAG